RDSGPGSVRGGDASAPALRATSECRGVYRILRRSVKPRRDETTRVGFERNDQPPKKSAATTRAATGEGVLRLEVDPNRPVVAAGSGSLHARCDGAGVAYVDVVELQREPPLSPRRPRRQRRLEARSPQNLVRPAALAVQVPGNDDRARIARRDVEQAGKDRFHLLSARRRADWPHLEVQCDDDPRLEVDDDRAARPR